MATKIFLIRHGLTLWNHEHRYQGHTDIELSEEGIKQAVALKKRFMNTELQAIYSSDLQRAVKTAEIINEAHQLPLQLFPELREINFGKWEGLTYEQIEKQYPQQLKGWITNPHLIKIPDGECLTMVQERAMRIMRYIGSEHPEGSLIVIAHGVIIATIICGFLRLSVEKMKDYKQDNTAVAMMTIEGNKASLDLFNDLSHLETSF